MRPPEADELSSPEETAGAKIPAASTTDKTTIRQETLVVIKRLLCSRREAAA
jgi:hypothetical protein